MEAAHKLITSNLRFVIKVSLEFRGYGIKRLDMIQEGNMGLIMVLKKFDPHTGYWFISYANLDLRRNFPHALENHTEEEAAILVVAAYPIRRCVNVPLA